LQQLKYSSPPATEEELLSRANNLAGKTLRQIAQELDIPMPPNLLRHKGWIGTLAERYLVATASTLAEPDFQRIGVELKTIPVNQSGLPKESTYVTTVTLSEITGSTWETSAVRKKLERVLWLPVESANMIPLAQRRFGSATLWSPTAEQDKILRIDWEEIMELVGTGKLDEVSSALGRYLQIRPKAANALSLGKFYANDGNPASTLPRGFYLRAGFTRSLFQHRV